MKLIVGDNEYEMDDYDCASGEGDIIVVKSLTDNFIVEVVEVDEEEEIVYGTQVYMNIINASVSEIKNNVRKL